MPARLVGRNWYVLEAAIHDHRFGSQAIAPVRDAEAPESRQKLASPRYEALSADELPPIIHPRQDGLELASISNEQDGPSQHLQDSWKEWFERIADTAASAIPDATATRKSPESVEEAEEDKKEEAVADEGEEDGKAVRIPIRAIHHQRYQAPPEELLPRALTQEPPRRRLTEEDEKSALGKAQEQRKMSRSTTIMIQGIGILLAILSIILVIISSGYFDTYISGTRVGVFAGIVTYNK